MMGSISPSPIACYSGNCGDRCLVGPTDQLFKIYEGGWENTISGPAEVVAMPRGFLLFRFNNVEDKVKVLTAGYWSMGARSLKLQALEPSFDPATADFKSIPVWISLHGFPDFVWNSEMLNGSRLRHSFCS